MPGHLPHISRRKGLGLLLAAISAFPTQAAAQSWPSRPVRIVVPFPPGGAADGSARVLAEVMSKTLSQSVIVENRPGAGSIVGTQAVVQSNDGHTLLMGSTSMTILPSLRSDLTYDITRDLQPIGMVSAQPLVLSVVAQSTLKTLDDVIARGRSGDLTAGNSDNGTLSHLTAELFNLRRDTKLVAVAYKGEAALVPDILNGTTSLAFLNLPSALPHLKSGRLRAIAVTSDATLAALPQVPTLKSTGLSDFVIHGWAALFAARDVPASGVARMEKELTTALADASVKERFAAFGVDAVSGTSAQLADYIRSELALWSGVIKSRGIKME